MGKKYIACIYHKPGDQRVSLTDVTRAELQKWVHSEHFLGKPILVEHKEGWRAGSITGSFQHPHTGSVFVEFELDASTAIGRETEKLVQERKLLSVSLSHWAYADGTPSEAREVSLCPLGARPNTVLVNASATKGPASINTPPILHILRPMATEASSSSPPSAPAAAPGAAPADASGLPADAQAVFVNMFAKFLESHQQRQGGGGVEPMDATPTPAPPVKRSREEELEKELEVMRKTAQDSQTVLFDNYAAKLRKGEGYSDNKDKVEAAIEELREEMKTDPAHALKSLKQFGTFWEIARIKKPRTEASAAPVSPEVNALFQSLLGVMNRVKAPLATPAANPVPDPKAIQVNASATSSSAPSRPDPWANVTQFLKSLEPKVDPRFTNPAKDFAHFDASLWKPKR
jgi:hypothetical protein